MSDFITGCTAPKDLMAVLKKYGLPDLCTGFVIRCDGPNEILTLSFEGYMREPKPGETFEDVKETRTFKLLNVD